MPTTADRLIGRDAELSRLEEELERLADDEPLAVAVVGEPGIGKTSLLDQLASKARSREVLLLRGRAQELERDLPFGVFVDALDRHLDALDPNAFRRLGHGIAAELAAVFPSLAEFAPDQPAMLQDERFRLHRAVRELLERLAVAGSFVLVLEDLHAADDASIELLAHLLSRPPEAGILFALSYRPRQAPPQLVAAIDGAARERGVDRIELGPLSQEDAVEMLGEALERVALESVYRETGGNPFYLEQLARTTGGNGRQASTDARERAAGRVATPAGDIDVNVPAAVAAAMASEVDALSPSGRSLLDAASVGCEEFDPELVSEIAGKPAAELLPALDELLEHDIVRPSDVPRRFRFRHPLLRRAVYESTGAAWRIEAHSRASHALAARGSSPLLRAPHVELSAAPGDEDAVAVLKGAGDAAATRAPAMAARWYRAAARLLPEHGPGSERRLELLVPLATSLAAAGRLEESHAVLVELLDALPPDAAAVRVRLDAACAGVEHLLGQHDQAERRLRAGLRELPDPNSPEAVILLFELALTSYYAADFTGLQEQAARTVELAETLGDDALSGTASALMTFAGAWSGALDEARSAADRASELMNALDDAQLALHLEIPYTLGWGEYFLERFEDAIGHLDRGIAVSRATGQGRLFVPMMLGRAMALVSLGRLHEATTQLEEAVGAARLLGHAQVLSWALWERCWAATATGDLETAIDAGEESIALGEGLDRNVLGAIAAWCLAAAKLEAGDAEGCVGLMLSAAGGDDLPLLPPGHRPFFCEVLVRAELSRGNAEEAERWARLAEKAIDDLGLRALARAHAKRARAVVQLAAGANAGGAESALASAEEATRAGAPVEAARSRLTAGRALIAGRERDRAVAELEKAESELDRCGAERWRDEARRELRAAGKPVHKRTKRGDAHADGLATLTGRELGVAELVTDRKTNKEIAAELFLSEKTVESHLRNIFAKLGVSSRVDVARAVERDHAETS